MAGELLFAGMGLGYLLAMGRELNDMNQVVAVMIVITFISVAADQLVFRAAEKRLHRRWGMD